MDGHTYELELPWRSRSFDDPVLWQVRVTGSGVPEPTAPPAPEATGMPAVGHVASINRFVYVARDFIHVP
jgi:hypothetical protein